MKNKKIKLDFKYKRRATYFERYFTILVGRGKEFVWVSDWVETTTAALDKPGMSPDKFVKNLLDDDGIKYEEVQTIITAVEKIRVRPDIEYREPDMPT